MTQQERDVCYDIIVVGAGMIGSAAAKHLLSLNPGVKVALIGPQDTEILDRSTIHGAHYDEGRITRELASDNIWSTLASRSIERYRDIESQSGISFYQEIGFLTIGKSGSPYMNSVQEVSEKNCLHHTKMDRTSLQKSFPYLRVAANTEGFFTLERSGHISPRALVKAQRQIAMMLGCDIFDDVASNIEDHSGHLLLTTDKGRCFKTKKVLLATGVFTHCRNLLPKNKLLSLKTSCTTVLLSEISQRDLHSFANMPCLIVEKECPSLENDCKNSGFYILPPIKYPNGKWYLKIGHSRDENKILVESQELDDWYKQKIVESQARSLLLKGRAKIFKGLKPVSEYFDQCAHDITVSLRPYVEMVTSKIGVAVGGCGWAAKSSDEIDLMAARMIHKGYWDYDLQRKHFQCHFNNKTLSKL